MLTQQHKDKLPITLYGELDRIRTGFIAESALSYIVLNLEGDLKAGLIAMVRDAENFGRQYLFGIPTDGQLTEAGYYRAKLGIPYCPGDHIPSVKLELTQAGAEKFQALMRMLEEKFDIVTETSKAQSSTDHAVEHLEQPPTATQTAGDNTVARNLVRHSAILSGGSSDTTTTEQQNPLNKVSLPIYTTIK